MQDFSEPKNLGRRNFFLLAAFCAMLFGFSLFEFRPLTMHEAVLPQCSREMLSNGDWLIPRCGGRPWLERPPLPMWLTAVVSQCFGGADAAWKVRLPANLAGLTIVLLTAQMAARWLGRTTGLLAGFCLATMVEFTCYSWLAEQDIFLCMLVTTSVFLFSRLEVDATQSETESAGAGRMSFFGGRSLGVLFYFASIGLTNLAKGMLFGPVMALLPVLGYLAWNFEWNQIRRYVWFWGWITTLVIAFAWPTAVLLRMPNALDLWLFDHVGRLDGTYQAINQPIWYYLVNLPWEIAPWTPLAIIGLWVAVRQAKHEPKSPLRLFVCWAILPVMVFTCASGKHHHYMLHILPAWSVLASIGIVWSWKKLFSARWTEGVLIRRMQCANAVCLVLIAGIFCTLHATSIPRSDGCLADTKFLREVKATFTDNAPVAINDDVDSMESFRNLFYLGDRPVLLHNLSYLLDQQFSVPRVRVLTRARDQAMLEKLGTVRMLAQSEKTRRETSPADRLTYFELEFRSHLARFEPPAPVSPMQAMHREDGPFVGGDQGRQLLRR